MPDIFDAGGQPDTTAPNITSPTSEAVRIRDKHTFDDLPQPLDARDAPQRIENVSTAHVMAASHKADGYSTILKSFEAGSNPLKSFLAKPIRMAFSTQAPGEQVLLLLRQHPITQIPWILTAMVAAVLPLFFSQLSYIEFLPLSYQTAVSIGWYLLLLGFIFESFLKWFFNAYIITDERIIDIDFYSLIYKNISSAKIDKIEDTTAQSAGLFAALFDYGTVTIQTAAEKREFEFDGIPHPTKVTTLINELILEEEREQIEGRVN